MEEEYVLKDGMGVEAMRFKDGARGRGELRRFTSQACGTGDGPRAKVYPRNGALDCLVGDWVVKFPGGNMTVFTDMEFRKAFQPAKAEGTETTVTKSKEEKE